MNEPDLNFLDLGDSDKTTHNFNPWHGPGPDHVDSSNPGS